MSVFKYKKSNFVFDFFHKKYINPIYQHLRNNTNNSVVLNENFNSELTIGNEIHEIKLIPPYFELQTPILPPIYKHVKIHRTDDFIINLEGLSNLEDYLKNQMGSWRRRKTRKSVKKIETCFNIKYAFYYGDISKKHYNFLFDKLELLIERRFDQRGDVFSLNDRMESIKKNAYQLILEKKASFFVIYDEDKPINIGLNYHFQNIVYASIGTYDIDYSKFELGHIDILKQIETCFNNNFKIFDFGWGELSYKRRWCNDIRLYEHHFIFKNKFLLKTLFVNLIIKLYKMNDGLQKTHVFKSIHKATVFFLKKVQFKTKRKPLVFSLEDITEMPLVESITTINIKNEAYAFLRKQVYDFQYKNSENSSTVQVFKINNDVNSYIIKGVKSMQKLIISDKN